MITRAVLQTGQLFQSDRHFCSFEICRHIGVPSDSMAKVRVSYALDRRARVLYKGLLMCRTAHVIPALVFLRNHGQEIILASVFHAFRSQHSYSQASLHNALFQTCMVSQGIGVGN